MKKIIKLIGVFVLISVVGLSIWHFFIVRPRTISTEINVKTSTANLTILNGQTKQNFDVSNFIGKTVLDATEAKTKVITKGGGQNAYITSINGIETNQQKREFWELDVNGTEASVGAGSYIIQGGDQISWKINTY